jgi:uncharacterized membrane protein YGL010W
MKIFEQLQAQHLVDLKVYRSAHSERWNVLLHKIFVPLECLAALALLWISMDLAVSRIGNAGLLAAFLKLLSPTVTLCLGVLSLQLAKNPHVGLATFLFHTMIVCLCETWIKDCAYSMILPTIALICWVVSMILQIVVGHRILERNSPNLANGNEVTFLAMCLSVLIAWSA